MSKKGITVYRLAKDTGIPYQTVHDIAKGRTGIHNTSFINAYKIAKVLSLSFDELFELEETTF